MCGRIVLKSPASEVARQFELPAEPPLEARYNIAPSRPIAVVRATAAGPRACHHLRWGLIPPWAADPRDGDRLFNARSETAARKPAFREAFAARRCLVPIDGFYEWRQRPAPRLPFYFSGADGRLLALAGLWSQWTSPGGELVESCTILTTAANRIVAGVHDRMPVILPPAAHERWLTTPPAHSAGLRDLLVPAPDGVLQSWPVAPLVGRAGAEGPELCAPARDSAPRQLGLF